MSSTDDAATRKVIQPHHIPVLVLFGTEYGFCREIAEKLCEQLRATEPFWSVTLCKDGHSASCKRLLNIYCKMECGVGCSDAGMCTDCHR